MEKLEALFDGFQHVQPPPHFILMGNFCSSAVTHGQLPHDNPIDQRIDVGGVFYMGRRG